MGRNSKVAPWAVRRRFMVAVIAFCMAVISFILFRNMASSVAEAAVTMAFTIIGSTVASYVFGATWHDINKKEDPEQ